MKLIASQLELLKQLRILHVEDDQAIYHQMQVIVGRYCPNLEWATDGSDAKNKIINEHIFDVIISDIRMPNMNGVELVRFIRKHHPEQHIVITSATEDTQSIIELINLGVNHFIAKPINFRELLNYLVEYCEYTNYQQTIEAKNLELKDALIQLEQTSGQLAESQRIASLAQLVTGIAHELNTPIGNCVTMCTHVKDNMDTIAERFGQDNITRPQFQNFLESGRDSLKFINDNLDKASALIRVFKQLSIAENVEARHQLDLDEIFAALDATYKAIAEQHNIALEFTNENSTPVFSYPDTMRQVLANLIQNALDHGFSVSKESGQKQPIADDAKIQISARTFNDELVIECADNGKSIDKNQLDKIFDPFYTTSRGLGNIGLGLTVAYNLVRSKLRGRIYCKSTPDEGTRFTICLPLRDSNSYVI